MIHLYTKYHLNPSNHYWENERKLSLSRVWRTDGHHHTRIRPVFNGRIKLSDTLSGLTVPSRSNLQSANSRSSDLDRHRSISRLNTRRSRCQYVSICFTSGLIDTVIPFPFVWLYAPSNSKNKQYVVLCSFHQLVSVHYVLNICKHLREDPG
jgi:hypothetical protein